MKEYTVNIETSGQITPDNWAVFRHSLKVDENTTIGEIEKWYKFHLPTINTQLTITELEKLIPES